MYVVGYDEKQSKASKIQDSLSLSFSLSLFLFADADDAQKPKTISK
jgi:hypothetical protein